MSLVATQSVAKILGLGAKVRTAKDLEYVVSEGLPKRALVLVTQRLHMRSSSPERFVACSAD